MPNRFGTVPVQIIRSPTLSCLCAMSVGLALDYGRGSRLVFDLCGPRIHTLDALVLHAMVMAHALPFMQAATIAGSLASLMACRFRRPRPRLAGLSAEFAGMSAGMIAGALVGASLAPLIDLRGLAIHWLGMASGMIAGQGFARLARRLVLGGSAPFASDQRSRSLGLPAAQS